MSSNSPSPDSVRQIAEELEKFVRWIADLIKRRHWFTLLLLLDVVLMLFFTPGGIVPKFFKDNFSLEIPQQYPAFFWLAVAGIFFAALIVAVVIMPRSQPDAVDLKERKAIKGLRAFTQEDAEIFRRLQRNRSIKDCLESLTNSNFRFGILMGESGCGKSSFLQAGLLPNLSKPESIHRGIYIRFSDRDPIETVCKTLMKELKLADGDSYQNFSSTLKRAVEKESKPLVLIFDQFEQFFVHGKRKEDREPFVSALTDWYRSPDPLPVKILVSIRGDFSHRLVELHRALGYSLSPQDVFPLEKFAPEEATNILSAIAETENLEFDHHFMREVVEHELASKEDGLISPVDLQVLAWTIERQNSSELRAFNRVAFQKFGGVEGLLTRFLDQTLAARVTLEQREAALKVLLALTNLEQQARIGVLTVQELQAKLKGTINPNAVEEAATWLARGDVRLITPVNRERTTAYELAHEQLISPLMRLAGRELSAADRANQLLDRRVNEWLGNQCSSRYLLTWRELWTIDRQKPYLIWGTKRQQKEKLLKRSRQRFNRLKIGIVSVGIVLIAVWSWLLTPWGQIQQVRWELARLSISGRISDWSLFVAAQSFAKDRQFTKVLKMSELYIADDIYKKLLLILSKKDIKEKSDLLFKLLDDRDININDEPLILVPVIQITQDVDRQNTFLLLQKIIKVIKNKYDFALFSYDFGTSPLIATAKATEILNKKQALNLLDDIFSFTKELDKFNQVLAFPYIGKAYMKWNKNKAKEILEYALDIIKESEESNIPLSDGKIIILTEIAKVYVILNKSESLRLLDEVLAINSKYDYDYGVDRAIALVAIANVYTTLDTPKEAITFLNEAFEIARMIQRPEHKCWVLMHIAEAQARLSNWGKARYIANRCTTEEGKVEALAAVLTVWAEQYDPKSVEEEVSSEQERSVKRSMKLAQG